MNTPMKLGCVGVMALATAFAMAQQEVEVTVNGQPVHFRGQGPIQRHDRVLVPLRGVLERMGADVRWNPDSQTVTARSSGTDVRLRIGERTASVNGQPVNLDVPAQIIGDTTMVPLRFVGEALGNTVHWDPNDQSVEIMTGGDTSYTVDPGRDRDRDRDQGRPNRMSPTRTTFATGTVFYANLDSSISSANNNQGDRFSADLVGNRRGLPDGTKLEGFVERVRPRTGDRPGMIELRFDRIDLPDGDTFPMHGAVRTVGSQGVMRSRNVWFDSGTRLAVTLEQDLRIRH